MAWLSAFFTLLVYRVRRLRRRWRYLLLPPGDIPPVYRDCLESSYRTAIDEIAFQSTVIKVQRAENARLRFERASVFLAGIACGVLPTAVLFLALLWPGEPPPGRRHEPSALTATDHALTYVDAGMDRSGVPILITSEQPDFRIVPVPVTVLRLPCPVRPSHDVPPFPEPTSTSPFCALFLRRD